jgi:hypothetical protein
LTRHRCFEEAIVSKDVTGAGALQVAMSRKRDAKKSRSRLPSAALRANRVNIIFGIFNQCHERR